MTTQPEQLDFLIQFLRFPSVSTNPEKAGDVRACAEWLCDLYRSAGLEARVHPTPGLPVVLARTPHEPAKKTVLIYGHYDVQPEDPLELWNSPPFEPRLENDRIWARGATDNKGQIMAHTLGVLSELKAGRELPVNVIFLVEGEEEIGSPHLAPFVEANREKLQADLIVISDTGMLGEGVPTFTYGLRGVAACELHLTGPATDLHSGVYGGAIVNPATALSHMLASLHDSGWRVTVDGFYDDVEPLEQWEREAWAQLPFNDDTMKKVSGAPDLDGEAGYTSLERTYARPTVEINGLTSGFQGVGTKTVLPSKASAKISMRLVPNQRSGKLFDLLEAHFQKVLPKGVSMEFIRGHAGGCYKVDPHSPAGKAAQRALQKTFSAEPQLIREGGSIPIVISFKELLGLDTLLLGLALPDSGMHAPNENFLLENFYKGIELNRALLQEIAEMPN